MKSSFDDKFYKPSLSFILVDRVMLLKKHIILLIILFFSNICLSFSSPIGIRGDLDETTVEIDCIEFVSTCSVNCTATAIGSEEEGTLEIEIEGSEGIVSNSEISDTLILSYELSSFESWTAIATYSYDEESKSSSAFGTIGNCVSSTPELTFVCDEDDCIVECTAIISGESGTLNIEICNEDADYCVYEETIVNPSLTKIYSDFYNEEHWNATATFVHSEGTLTQHKSGYARCEGPKAIITCEPDDDSCSLSCVYSGLPIGGSLDSKLYIDGELKRTGSSNSQTLTYSNDESFGWRAEGHYIFGSENAERFRTGRVDCEKDERFIGAEISCVHGIGGTWVVVDAFEEGVRINNVNFDLTFYGLDENENVVGTTRHQHVFSPSFATDFCGTGEIVDFCVLVSGTMEKTGYEPLTLTNEEIVCDFGACEMCSITNVATTCNTTHTTYKFGLDTDFCSATDIVFDFDNLGEPIVEEIEGSTYSKKVIVLNSDINEDSKIIARGVGESVYCNNNYGFLDLVCNNEIDVTIDLTCYNATVCVYDEISRNPIGGAFLVFEILEGIYTGTPDPSPEYGWADITDIEGCADITFEPSDDDVDIITFVVLATYESSWGSAATSVVCSEPEYPICGDGIITGWENCESDADCDEEECIGCICGGCIGEDCPECIGPGCEEKPNGDVIDDNGNKPPQNQTELSKYFGCFGEGCDDILKGNEPDLEFVNWDMKLRSGCAGWMVIRIGDWVLCDIWWLILLALATYDSWRIYKRNKRKSKKYALTIYEKYLPFAIWLAQVLVGFFTFVIIGIIVAVIMLIYLTAIIDSQYIKIKNKTELEPKEKQTEKWFHEDKPQTIKKKKPKRKRKVKK
ncbi:hypothetical protein KO465_01350 [Candidatus Micrarchaeota archaeon]|nr:hypothetical protein [Candidatus Micrarchaeota archaeon]